MDIMNHCKGYRKLVSRYVDNDLTDEEKQLLKGHLSSCMECMDVLNGYSVLRNYIRESCVIPVLEKAPILPKQSDRPWTRFLVLFNPGIRFAVIGVATVLFLGGGILLRTERNGQSPIVIGNESAGMMNTPLGAMVYYEEFAGKTVSVQFAKLQTIRNDPDGQNGFTSFTNAVGYESPLFHDNSLMKQRYDKLNKIDAF